jgi:hypothetical protein
MTIRLVTSRKKRKTSFAFTASRSALQETKWVPLKGAPYFARRAAFLASSANPP